ncbi:sigma factor-like helix-turn-helix DNA-binding protein [Streptomyces sp. cg40]|uniref:sigma factor-like helix-turn-helix DNA-binding protein n=1 Tax=Streptomyces sp. cg40 TaxID=3419764 RepID=UPI003CFD8F61
MLTLRNFSGITSYQEIAEACEVPVGTVRSRLNQARAKMAKVLLSTRTQGHEDAAAITEGSRQEAEVTLDGAMRGQLPGKIVELWPAETELVGVLNKEGGRVHPFPAMRGTRTKGVTEHPRHVVASRDIAIREMEAVNPAGISNPCPPSLAWLMFRQDGWVRKLRVVFPGALSGGAQQPS